MSVWIDHAESDCGQFKVPYARDSTKIHQTIRSRDVRTEASVGIYRERNRSTHAVKSARTSRSAGNLLRARATASSSKSTS